MVLYGLSEVRRVRGLVVLADEHAEILLERLTHYLVRHWAYRGFGSRRDRRSRRPLLADRNTASTTFELFRKPHAYVIAQPIAEQHASVFNRLHLNLLSPAR